jgi:Starch-binding associating with outer membrane/Susd and RagB outer membrane lipoprotein
MRTSSKLLMLGALLAFGAAACGDFLSGPGLTSDPNAPSAASRDQRLAAVQANLTVQLTGDLARSTCMWMQQCAGVDRQYATRELYTTSTTDFDPFFIAAYTGGGLIDIRAIEAEAASAGDSVYVGVGKVLEALDVGETADLWGDIPYSDAVGSNATPRYDTQQAVYTALLGVLTQAVAELAGPGAGPGQIDLWYLGDKAAWTELAHTLKARTYLHLASRVAGSYANALTEARLGISTSAHDLQTFASAATTENNLWYQFSVIQRDTYLRYGAELVDSIMKKRNDPRLPLYFAPLPVPHPAWAASHKYRSRTKIFDSNGNMEQVTGLSVDSISGAAAPAWNTTLYGTTPDNHVTWTNVGPLPYAGAQPGDPYDPSVESNLSATRLGAGFRQPTVTFAETQLIIAEAAYQTGDQAGALASLNAERTAAGLPALGAGVTGVALLDSIMIEKYVATFQNIETWSDLRRTCIPALVPANLSNAGGHVIGRLLYTQTEASTNPNALADPVSGRNWNDTSTGTCP